MECFHIPPFQRAIVCWKFLDILLRLVCLVLPINFQLYLNLGMAGANHSEDTFFWSRYASFEANLWHGTLSWMKISLLSYSTKPASKTFCYASDFSFIGHFTNALLLSPFIASNSIIAYPPYFMVWQTMFCCNRSPLNLRTNLRRLGIIFSLHSPENITWYHYMAWKCL